MSGVASDEPDQRALAGFDIICLGMAEWLLVHSIAHYTMLGVKGRNRVVYIEPFRSIVTGAPELQPGIASQAARKRLRHLDDGFWIYRPPRIALPGASRSSVINRVNGLMLAILLRLVAHRLGFRNVLLWSFLYNSASVLRSFPARLRIYECVDNDAALARGPRRRKLVQHHERATCRAADVVFGVTDELCQTLRPFNPETHEINCAAAPEVFSKSLAISTLVPADLTSLSRPVIGYLGGVDPWKIDVDLLLGVAAAHPDWSIVLVGYVWFGFDKTALAAAPNIHILGPKPYAMFPAYLKGMDVCIMPFPLNEITLFGDALKAYEYLAGGRPVVSTRVPAARRLTPAVRIAETANAFVREIEEALGEPSAAVADRLAAVAQHTWAARISQKSAIIRAVLSRRPAPR